VWPLVVANAIIDLIVQLLFLFIMSVFGRVLDSSRNVLDPNSLEKCSIMNHNPFMELFG
jgi:hypothetical protein